MRQASEPLIVTHIVAIAKNRVIGADGKLPWHLPEDLKFFKAETTGHAIIMGRKTFDSIGKALPGRLSIVVSRRPAPTRAEGDPNLIFVASVDEAFAAANVRRGKWGDEVFVIGGGEIYRATLERADKIFLTEVAHDVPGDVTYPEFQERDFTEELREDFAAPFAYSRRTLIRKKN